MEGQLEGERRRRRLREEEEGYSGERRGEEEGLLSLFLIKTDRVRTDNFCEELPEKTLLRSALNINQIV